MTYQIAQPFRAKIGDELTKKRTITTNQLVGLDEVSHEARKTMLREMKQSFTGNHQEFDDIDFMACWGECPAITGWKRPQAS